MKLVVTEFVSLDGVMEAPGGEPDYPHTGWVEPFFSEQLFAYKLAEQLGADVLLLGRVMYESFFGAWPDREGPMADKINTMRKVVVSNTLASSPWTDTSVIGGADVMERIAALKAEGDGTILVIGSRTLVHGLFAAGLVDELHVQVFPLILGSGKRLYPDSPDLTRLELVESIAFDSGVIAQSYRVS